MRNYNSLNSEEKTLITKLLTAREHLEKAKKEYEKAVEKSFSVVKEYKSVEKEHSKISFTPASVYSTLDTTKIKVENSLLYDQLMLGYSKQIERKESITVKL